MSSLPMDADVQLAAQAERLRQVVGGLLPGPQVERLLSLWRECQLRQAHCSVPGFVAKVAGELQLDAALAGKLRMTLFAEVLARRPAPAPRSEPVARAAPQAAPNRPKADAPSQVFMALMSHLDAMTRSRHPDRWSGYCAALAAKLRSQPVPAFQVGPLLAGERPPADLAAPVAAEADRQALVHACYLALCEVLGPVPADRLLSDAVRRVEQQPAAARYAPRRLL